MKLTILGSSSRGNGYVLQSDTEALVIECGVPLQDALIALGFDSRKVAACIVTHEHGDHSKYIEQYMEMMPVYTSQGTAEALRFKGERRPAIFKPLFPIRLGGFTVLPFDTEHDSAEPLGFLIAHPEMGTLLFATDTYYLKYKFDDLNHIMIECNYAADILEQNVKEGKIHPVVQKRTIRSHMSLSTTISTLQANNLNHVCNIIILHLSGQNSCAKRFKESIEISVGKRVEVAGKGKEILLSKTPF